MAPSGKQIILGISLSVGLLGGCAQERDARLVGSWAGDNEGKGLTFHADGTAVLFSARKPVNPEYGAPLRWQTSNRNVVVIRMIDEEGNIGGPTSISYQINKDELVLSESYELYVPRKLKMQK